MKVLTIQCVNNSSHLFLWSSCFLRRSHPTCTLPFHRPASIAVVSHSQTAYLSFGVFSKSTIDSSVRAFWSTGWNVSDSGLFLYSSKVSPAVSYSVPSLIILDGFCGRKTPLSFSFRSLLRCQSGEFTWRSRKPLDLLQKSVVGRKLARQKLTGQTYSWQKLVEQWLT